jgi:hypothetical protein
MNVSLAPVQVRDGSGVGLREEKSMLEVEVKADPLLASFAGAGEQAERLHRLMAAGEDVVAD